MNIGDEAGFSLDLSDDGTHLAVGSAFNDNGGASAGHVRVYSFTNEGWKQKGDPINGSLPYEYSGSSLALVNYDDPGGAADVLIVAVGAPGAYGNRVALRSTSGKMKRGNRGVSIYMETTTAISLDSRCLSRPMGHTHRQYRYRLCSSVRVENRQVGRRQFGHLGRICW